jgi:amidase
MEEYNILELQTKMESGEMTARGIVEMYLATIEARGDINAVIELNPDALSIADTLDMERNEGKVRGPLHGIPIMIKDNIDTHDKMQTTAGSLALAGSIAPKDAFLVERLRAAGAIILGKTNLSEWANFRGQRSSSGWSSRGGLTRNPYALDRTACGSSSGSGAAVAANLCAAAIGTETDGSVICPSTTNGIVGIKPTLGLISRSGIIPIAHNQDTAGPMARTVADAATLLGGLTGIDEKDEATKQSEGHGLNDYGPFLKKNGLQGARIGVARGMAGSDPRIKEIFDRSIAKIEELGATVVDPVEVSNFDNFGETELEVLHYEYKAGLNKYFASLGPDAKIKDLDEVIQFNEENAEKVLQYFGQEHMLAAQAKGDLTDETYLEALAKNLRLTREEGIDAALAEHKLDAIIVPSGGPAWLIDLVNGDSYNWDMASTSVPAVAGYPHITVPMGYIFGLPVGLSFFSTAWQEPKLIQYAYAFEQATLIRQPPQFLPHAKV